MMALLERLVNTDSGPTTSPRRRGGRAYLPREHGIASEVTPDATYGDAITATVGANRPILLMGHRTRCFPKACDAPAFKIEGGRALGRAFPT